MNGENLINTPENNGENGQELLMEAVDLVKAYSGRRVVDNVNLNVKRGEVVGLLGPNGAGKTTSFYMVTGLIQPDSGIVKFKGLDGHGYCGFFTLLEFNKGSLKRHLGGNTFCAGVTGHKQVFTECV